MNYYKDLFNNAPINVDCGSCVTLGTFDGVHKGHQKLISTTIQEAQQRKYTSIAITFDPLPKMFFQKHEPIRLVSSEGRAGLIEELGPDILIEYTFDESFSQMDASEFINKVLGNLNPKKLFIGNDFRFGYRGTGDSALLEERGKELGFDTVVVDFVNFHNQRISSSRIRKAIKSGKMELAADLMGKHHRLAGKILRKINNYRLFIVAEEGLILPPKGGYMINLQYRNKCFKTKSLVHENRLIEVIMKRQTGEEIFDHNIIIEFLYSLENTHVVNIKQHSAI